MKGHKKEIHQAMSPFGSQKNERGRFEQREKEEGARRMSLMLSQLFEDGGISYGGCCRDFEKVKTEN